MLRNGQPYTHSPSGVTDTLDGTNTPPGGMALLTNLIPDPSTRNLWNCRPAGEEVTDFTGFTTPTFISVLRVIGEIAYGMIASAAFPGLDEPFAYDIENDAFITITGQSALNLPLSPSSAGAWQPPRTAMVGVYLLFTHPGFPNGSGDLFGWLDLTNPAAPVWDAGNTGTNALLSAPKDVGQFNNRAYYAVGNTVVFTDALDPLTVSSSSDVLTLGDSTDVTALGELGLNNAFLGGVTQSLIAFKGVVSIFQITGDADAVGGSTLALNTIPVSTGTFAPNSICGTPKGLAFVSPEGLRILDFDANVTDPIGKEGFGVAVPFIFSVVPSRMCAAYNTGVIRITTQDGNAAGTPTGEYWFHMPTQQWSGPHTNPASVISPYLNSFIKSIVGVDAKLFESKTFQTLSSVYEENGEQLTWKWRTANMPDTGSMNQNALIETLVRMQFPSGMGDFNFYALDENSAIVDTVAFAPGGAATVWGAFVWGSAVWGGTLNQLAPRQIQWTIPIVFRVLALYATGDSIGSFKIGNLWMRYQQLGYLQASA